MTGPLCLRCEHPVSAHCKGEQLHTDHKEDARMVPQRWRRNNTICHTRHCLYPLCSCVDLVLGESQ